jgi:D-sedoheptulose 7-phosphate isomerase
MDGMTDEQHNTARETIVAALAEAQTLLDQLLKNEAALSAIASAAAVMVAALRRGGRIYACGNGGSMSDAMHFAEELTGRFRDTRRGYAAQAISDVGHITCVGNDFGYDQIFSRYIESHGRKDDCLLAISTSGTSANVVRAAQVAKDLGLEVIVLTGRAGTALEALSTVCISTPGGMYADRVQELHIKVIHILLELIELHFSQDEGINSDTALFAASIVPQ